LLRKLIDIFRGAPPSTEISDRFVEMLTTAQEMVLEASTLFWERSRDPDRRRALRAKDVQVNKLERWIRKRVLVHLAVGGTSDVPFGLVMMSVVKDVERLGDYAKNLAEAVDFHEAALPAHPVVDELGAIRTDVEALATQALAAWVRNDTDRATDLTREGRNLGRRCEDLLRQLARSDLPASSTVSIALAARYYKRIEAHFSNLLSSLIMPLHKLDFFDEKELEEPNADESAPP
jgi:phosphate transport system protein